jgi:hypothetical protein
MISDAQSVIQMTSTGTAKQVLARGDIYVWSAARNLQWIHGNEK